MTKLTIRNQSKDLDAALRRPARERSWSLNQAANYLLMKGAGLLDDPTPAGIGNALDDFIGSWSEAEADAASQRINDASEQIDKDL